MRILLDSGSQGGGGMSTGGLIGGGLAGLVSAPFQIFGSMEEQKKMNEVLQQELARQRAYQQTGQGILAEHVAQNTLPEVNKSIAAGSNAALAGYRNAPMIAQPGGAALPTIGGSFLGPSVAGANKTSNQGAAGVQGYTDWSVKQALENLKARTRLSQNNQFAQQSNSVLAPELQAAQNSQSGLMAFGSLLGDAAGVASMAAL